MSSTVGAEDLAGSGIRTGEESGDGLASASLASETGGFEGGGEPVSSRSGSV